MKSPDFNPDWLPPHPMMTLLDLVDEDPNKFVELLGKKFVEKYYDEASWPKEFNSLCCLSDFIQGSDIAIDTLTQISGRSRKFWENKYKNYWKRRNESI